MYKTEPIIVDTSGFKGLFGGKKLNGFNVKENNFSDAIKETKSNKSATASVVAQEIKSIPKTETVSASSKKTQSTSQLSKALGVSQPDITNIMQQSGLINGGKITSAGLAKGLVIKNYMGKDYIAYPENLDELKKISRQTPSA